MMNTDAMDNATNEQRAKVNDVERSNLDDGLPLPDLRFHDQTPIMRSVGKRLCSELSPLAENDEVLMGKIESMIKTSLATHLPSFIAQVQSTIDQSIKTLITEHITPFKDEIREELKHQERQNTLQVKSEAEMLESYNRRENLRIIGVEGKVGHEENDTTASKVLEVAKKMDANVTEWDISIAHRLPSLKPGPKPIIVRFARRVARISMLKNKKKLPERNLPNVRVYEDLTMARIRFFNLMKADSRINKAWTRDGTIFFIWKEDNKTYTINNLYDGGLFLEYSIDDVEECFTFNRE